MRGNRPGTLPVKTTPSFYVFIGLYLLLVLSTGLGIPLYTVTELKEGFGASPHKIYCTRVFLFPLTSSYSSPLFGCCKIFDFQLVTDRINRSLILDFLLK